MTEPPRSTTSATGYCPFKMESDLTPKKTMLILVIVVGCFAVLWPKVFYPMLVGSATQHIKPSAVDKTTGCCDVISEIDVNTIKIVSELCGSIIKQDQDDNSVLGPKQIFAKCRSEILDTCGIDISLILQDQVKLGQNVKQILDQIRSLNGSLCLKYNFGVAPWRLGVPHRITVKMSETPNIRQERPLYPRSEMIHPAFRERGRAIPQPQPTAQSRPPPRIVEGRPGPVPGMRPTIGGAGHVVPPPKQGTNSMSVIMPIYTIGIVIFFTYTLMKIMFKKQPEGPGGALYPPIEPDPHFRKEVFESERHRFAPRLDRDNASKLGDAELDQLRQRLRETELAMERIVHQMSKVPLKTQDLVNGLSNGSAVKSQDPPEDSPSVTVVGMEMRASCENGKKWSRSESPIPPTVSSQHHAEPSPPPQEIYLEGALPAQSHLLVADSAIEAQDSADDPAVVLAGKMTLSVVSLDSSENDAICEETPKRNKETENDAIYEKVTKTLDESEEIPDFRLDQEETFDSVKSEIDDLIKEAEKIAAVETQILEQSQNENIVDTLENQNNFKIEETLINEVINKLTNKEKKLKSEEINLDGTEDSVGKNEETIDQNGKGENFSLPISEEIEDFVAEILTKKPSIEEIEETLEQVLMSNQSQEPKNEETEEIANNEENKMDDSKTKEEIFEANSSQVAEESKTSEENEKYSTTENIEEKLNQNQNEEIEETKFENRSNNLNQLDSEINEEQDSQSDENKIIEEIKPTMEKTEENLAIINRNQNEESEETQVKNQSVDVKLINEENTQDSQPNETKITEQTKEKLEPAIKDEEPKTENALNNLQEIEEQKVEKPIEETKKSEEIEEEKSNNPINLEKNVDKKSPERDNEPLHEPTIEDNENEEEEEEEEEVLEEIEVGSDDEDGVEQEIEEVVYEDSGEETEEEGIEIEASRRLRPGFAPSEALHTSASNATTAENDISDEEITDDEEEVEYEEEEIDEEDEIVNNVNHIRGEAED